MINTILVCGWNEKKPKWKAKGKNFTKPLMEPGTEQDGIIRLGVKLGIEKW